MKVYRVYRGEEWIADVAASSYAQALEFAGCAWDTITGTGSHTTGYDDCEGPDWFAILTNQEFYGSRLPKFIEKGKYYVLP